jgi:CDGSH-type Zn-finger protein/uncharacterized Fe-S cluster protein YjdI
MSEPVISVRSREDLIYLLTEAAEIEHNLMCCYLFAAFGMKTEADGLDAPTAALVQGWKRAVTAVAVEEMTHLALVNNLLVALGAAPHLGRPNFPVAPGYHPAGIVVELHRFEPATLDHFIYLERPEGVSLPDAPGFTPRVAQGYTREAPGRSLMPSAQDYETVGHLYRSIRDGLSHLAATLGEATLFAGDPALQVAPPLVQLPGLAAITSLATAQAALDTIVEQGEGSPQDTAHSHYRRFLAIREAWQARLATEPGFDPSRKVAPNPVMRRPPTPQGKTFIDDPKAAAVIDYGNAIYGAMLRAMAQGFATADPKQKQALFDASIDAMFALVPVAEHLTTLPACHMADERRAGLSFAMLRDVAAFPPGAAASALLAERFADLAQGTACLNDAALAAQVGGALTRIAERLSGKVAASAEQVEIAEGRDLVISFNARLCIHARFCVLGEPGVFKANVVGPWIAPDDATSTEGLIGVARNCPSGAITYRRKDGGEDEPAPPVNLVQVRENGPLALRAALVLDGAAAGNRATLCRCGQSKNKPYCDGSHVAAGFAASGEPATGDVTALAVRDGPLDIRPQTNGPLVLSGNMEMISGTGRTFRKTTGAMLCRCGASGSKPFCDGSHARVGFKS